MKATSGWPAALFWLGLVLCVGTPAVLIARKEHLLATGRPVLLRLAPVDPRSLMQGDYMALRYALGTALLESRRDDSADSEEARKLPERGVVVVRVEADGVGTFARLDAGEPTAPDEQRLRYHTQRGFPRFGAEEFFFEEGQGEHFSAAKYGELRVSEDGTALLVGLRDEARQPL